MSATQTQPSTTLPAAIGVALKILADGTQVPATDPRTDHVALLFPDGWMIHPVTLTDDGEEFDNADAADQAARDLRVLGYDDWQSAPLEVWERHVLDRTRFSPAVDPNLYPGIQRSGWHWTSTPAAWSVDKATGVASSAWYVNSGYGLVYDGVHRGNDGFGLAARRVGQ